MPTIEENRVTRTKKYSKLSATEKIQAECDMKATNIILQGLPADIYSLVNHHRVAKDLWERDKCLILRTGMRIIRESTNVVKCFKLPRYSHMARHCPKPKRKRDATWFRDKVLLVEAQGNGKVLNEEEFVNSGRPQ
ncbi:hypothetical protein Tco_1400142 [Tanacetum coccineum]